MKNKCFQIYLDCMQNLIEMLHIFDMHKEKPITVYVFPSGEFSLFIFEMISCYQLTPRVCSLSLNVFASAFIRPFLNIKLKPTDETFIKMDLKMVSGKPNMSVNIPSVKSSATFNEDGLSFSLDTKIQSPENQHLLIMTIFIKLLGNVFHIFGMVSYFCVSSSGHLITHMLELPALTKTYFGRLIELTVNHSPCMDQLTLSTHPDDQIKILIKLIFQTNVFQFIFFQSILVCT